MNGLRSYLLVYGGLQAAVPLAGSSAALMWRLEIELAQKPIPVLWMQFNFFRLALEEEPHIQDRDRRHMNCGTVLKTCHLLL